MTPELIGILITGIISGLDVVVNIFTACCHGRLKIDSGCCHVEHDDEPDLLTQSKVEMAVAHGIEKSKK